MSDWALELVREHYGRHDYGVPPKYRRAFEQDPAAAVTFLIQAAEPRPSLLRDTWQPLIRHLPPGFRDLVTLSSPRRPHRWAALLALSNLARRYEDRRIAPFFLFCMADSNVPVRKIAAFEAGPWLNPHDQSVAIQILTAALKDPEADVRRDGCRRILLSAPDSDLAYSEGVTRLLPTVHRLAVDEPTPEVLKALSAFETPARKVGKRSEKD